MELPKRKSNRLKNYDYNTPAAYFVTVCTRDRKNIFWDNVGATIGRPFELSEYGKIVDTAIKNAQNILKTLGYNVGRTDGYFDESTVSAVKEFQVDHSIEATGVIDNKTASELTLALREKIRDKQYDTQLQKAIGMLQQ